jgi:hypothetical protein
VENEIHQWETHLWEITKFIYEKILGKKTLKLTLAFDMFSQRDKA